MGHTRDEIAAVEDPFCLCPAVELALRSFEVLVFDINFTTYLGYSYTINSVNLDASYGSLSPIHSKAFITVCDDL